MIFPNIKVLVVILTILKDLLKEKIHFE